MKKPLIFLILIASMIVVSVSSYANDSPMQAESLALKDSAGKARKLNLGEIEGVFKSLYMELTSFDSDFKNKFRKKCSIHLEITQYPEGYLPILNFNEDEFPLPPYIVLSVRSTGPIADVELSGSIEEVSIEGETFKKILLSFEGGALSSFKKQTLELHVNSETNETHSLQFQEYYLVMERVGGDYIAPITQDEWWEDGEAISCQL